LIFDYLNLKLANDRVHGALPMEALKNGGAGHMSAAAARWTNLTGSGQTPSRITIKLCTIDYVHDTNT